jgi:hypothetical protein
MGDGDDDYEEFFSDDGVDDPVPAPPDRLTYTKDGFVRRNREEEHYKGNAAFGAF